MENGTKYAVIWYAASGANVILLYMKTYIYRLLSDGGSKRGLHIIGIMCSASQYQVTQRMFDGEGRVIFALTSHALDKAAPAFRAARADPLPLSSWRCA